MQATDKRQVIVDRLSLLMPEPYRAVAALFAERAVSGIPDSELDNVLGDVDNVPEAIEKGDTDYLFGIARKYGASEEQINQVAAGGMPLFPSSVFGDS